MKKKEATTRERCKRQWLMLRRVLRTGHKSRILDLNEHGLAATLVVTDFYLLGVCVFRTRIQAYGEKVYEAQKQFEQCIERDKAYGLY